MLDKLRDGAMRSGMRLMGNPRVMKLVSSPRVMQAMMKAVELRGEVQSAVDARLKRLARTFKLATRDDLSTLQSTIRGLESALKNVQAKVEGDALKGK